MAVNLQQLEKEGIYEAKSSLASLLSDLDQISLLCRDVKARKGRQAKTGGFIFLAGLMGTLISAAFPRC